MNSNRKKYRRIRLIELFVLLCIIVLIMCLLFNVIRRRTLRLLQGNNKYIDLAVDAKTKNSSNYTNVTSLDGIDVPVPSGFVASTINSERSVSSGFVIYEGIDPVPNDDTTEEGLKEIRKAQNSRNQFVWIPVSSELSNQLYRITDDGIIYANRIEINNTNYSIDTSAVVEPVVSSNELDYGTATDIPLFNWRRGKTAEDMLSAYRQKFYETMVSIKTYGGFYIARYESPLTINGELMSRRYVQYQRYDYAPFFKMYTSALNMKKENECVDTHIIWNVLWDCTQVRIAESGAATFANLINNSYGVSHGNCTNSSFTYYTLDTDYSLISHNKDGGTDTLIPTGSSDSTMVYNIFDMVGNYYEFSMSNKGANKDTTRGGVYTQGNQQFNTSSESIDKGGHEVATRVILYIK
ncbi:MAG: hypothetical protein K6D97_03555 [Clostridia bacterium]|nr:hypothetical protein [Clostridia bacterium]